MTRSTIVFGVALHLLTLPDASAQLWHNGGLGLGIQAGYQLGADGGILIGFHAGYFHRGEGSIIGGLIEETFYLQTGKDDFSIAAEFRTVRTSSPRSYGGRFGVVFADAPMIGWRVTAFVGTSAAFYSSITFLPFRSSEFQIGVFARAVNDLSNILRYR